jgi:hypothetical protein
MFAAALVALLLAASVDGSSALPLLPLAWNRSVPMTGNLPTFYTTFGCDLVFFTQANDPGVFQAFETATGKPVWNVSASGGPVVSRSGALVVLLNGTAARLEGCTGRVVWHAAVAPINLLGGSQCFFSRDGRTPSGPREGEDYVVCTPRSQVAAIVFRVADGSIVWQGPYQKTYGPVLPVGGGVIAMSMNYSGNSSTGVDVATGKTLWKISPGISGADVFESSGLFGRYVPAGNVNKYVVASSRTGQFQWDGPGTLVFVKEVASTRPSAFFAGVNCVALVDLATGKVIWKRCDAGSNWYSMYVFVLPPAPGGAGQRLAYGGYNGLWLYVVDIATGQQLGMGPCSIATSSFEQSVLFVNGAVATMSTAKGFVAINATTNTPAVVGVVPETAPQVALGASVVNGNVVAVTGTETFSTAPDVSWMFKFPLM